MAELRSTDIIDKLSKLKKDINDLQTIGITTEKLREKGVVFGVKINNEAGEYDSSTGIIDLWETLKNQGFVFQINANGEQYPTYGDGIIDLGDIGGLTEDEKKILGLLRSDHDEGEDFLELNNANLTIPQNRAIYTPNIYINRELSKAFTDNEKSKLSSIEEGAQKNPGLVTTSADGLMGFSDKRKLDNISSNANYYTVGIIDLRNS